MTDTFVTFEVTQVVDAVAVTVTQASPTVIDLTQNLVTVDLGVVNVETMVGVDVTQYPMHVAIGVVEYPQLVNLAVTLTSSGGAVSANTFFGNSFFPSGW